jgi:DNA-directed RNA polymerase specialized sigma subunit
MLDNKEKPPKSIRQLAEVKRSKGANKNDFSFSVALEGLLKQLPERSQAIIKNRFGLAKEKPQTLEKTGNIFGITRERVRQIITDSIKKISQKKDHPDFIKAQSVLFFTISQNSGIMKEVDIANKFNQGKEAETNALNFFSSCFSSSLFFESEDIEKSWILDKAVAEKAKQVKTIAEAILIEKKKPLEEGVLVNEIQKKTAENGLTQKEILDFLQVLKKIKPNKFGKWGMADWKEINPRGTREKIYAVLQEEEKPLHFSQIAKLIDSFHLGRKKAHPQTIHNELIKNDQFVLIGRGIYALKEWGYSEGTVKDVLKRIIKNSRVPLKKEDILSEVFKIRQVKKATVLINLNNDNVFVKESNYYRLK